MNFGKKQMIIGAAVLVGGYLLYKKFYAKPAAPATGGETTSTPPADTATPVDENAATPADTDTEAVANETATTEGFLGRGKRKGKPMGNRKEKLAKYYLTLLKRGMNPMEAEQTIRAKILGSKRFANKQAAAAAMSELAEVVSTPKATLNEVKEARTVGGGDGFLSQSFMM